MNRKPLNGWLQHADFILLDFLALQLSFAIAYWIRHGFSNPYENSVYRFLALTFLIGQFLTVFFFSDYTAIIRRGPLHEVFCVLRADFFILVFTLGILFAIQQTGNVSRIQVVVTMAVFLFVDWLFRYLNKQRLYHKSANSGNRLGRSLVLITAGSLVDQAMYKLTAVEYYRSYFVSGIVLTDGDFDAVKNKYDVPIREMNDETMKWIRSGWVDEVFILQSDDNGYYREEIDDLIDMGITIHVCPEILEDENLPSVEMTRLGRYSVLTSSLKFVAPEKLIIKRIFDIIGGIVGCIITGILCIFIGPAIYFKSPGPIFFAQDRVGQNGRIFKMYKFRSMYLDAEARKAELMKQNKISSDYMFKLDDDPRIIGSEHKDKNGKPCGIGNFIRRTSIDEFPQFWNVLKGDMSLVGTRPPLKEEWEKYNPHHRARMTVKPGITGLWQVSGRSDITEFEEVVRLDKEYIQNWSFYLDFKIILKTILLMFTKRGSS